MQFDLLFEWILNWVKVTPPLGSLGLQQRCFILLMMIHVMQNITVKPICPYIGVVVFSIIIHNIKTIPEVSMHLCKFLAKVTPFYGTFKILWTYFKYQAIFLIITCTLIIVHVRVLFLKSGFELAPD